ncbi:MAG: CRTAC1 family protein, partial [bacterium]
SGILELKGPAGPLMGTPLLTFSHDISIQMVEQEAILDAIRFNDATSGAGLDKVNQDVQSLPASKSGALAVADFDRDRDQDLYVSVWSPGENRNTPHLYRNDFGLFVDIAAEAGIAHQGRDLSSLFADYDNDGFLDLFIVNDQNNLLYANVEEGKFSNVAESAMVAEVSHGRSAHFADFDHDSDLDLYITSDGDNRFFRYNGDKTYTELSEKAGVAGGATSTRDLAFGDFDEDGDLDFFVVNDNASNILYTNLRQGRFEDITSKAGLASHGGSGAVTVGDYNNDGFLDLFVTAINNGQYFLYKNNGEGLFEKDTRSDEMLQKLRNVSGLDTRFFDFDNDGFLDILVVGKSSGQSRGVLLFHNDGTGKFRDVSTLLPEDLQAGEKVAIFDYNEDGDLDFFITGEDGSLRLLRNDGGNVNKYLKVQLVGIRTGSGKNNHFGIGSKLEVRAGDLYQIRVVNEPMTHFGLGQRLKADVVRILWPNGVPQNLFFAGSDQDLIEEQTLKGSCAFVYPWDGEKYEFATDIMWRSALGMPLGIMGGETAYAFPNSSADYFKIPGEMLKPRDGKYSIQITEELWETAFFDKVRLIAVDHPDSVDIFIDERFVPPPIPPLRIFTVANKRIPKSAIDEHGVDHLAEIAKKDDEYIANMIPAKYQGITQLHDLILDLGDFSGDTIVLYLQGWIFPTDASINVALAQSDDLKIVLPYLQVINQKGAWQTVVPDLSFPMGKNKTVVIDLSGKFLTDDHRVRIRTNMQVYWDHIFFTVDEPKVRLQETTHKPIAADLHYRGFSRLYRKGGRYGPHWFDYGDVTTEQKWRDLVGNYTRYGDVLPLLLESDDMYVILNAGDEVTVEFDANQTPQLKPGWKRDFLIFGDGWIKDGDLNTAHGQTVEPLPYHGMSSYPYGPNDAYPLDEEHKKFIMKYNTRRVRNEKFLWMRP